MRSRNTIHTVRSVAASALDIATFCAPARPLSCVASDMRIVLLLFRILGQGRQIEWVQRINDTAKGIVDPLNTAIRRGRQSLRSVPLSQKRVRGLSVRTLCLVRFLVCMIVGLLLA